MKKSLLVFILYSFLSGSCFAASEPIYPEDEQEESNSSDIECTEPCWKPAPEKACAWEPKEVAKPNPFQCGSNDIGLPNMAVYECGLSINCEEQCRFLNCYTP